MKQQVGAIIDENFTFIMQLFDFESISDFIFPPNFSTIEVYINTDQPENINWSYWGGFILTIRSATISGEWLDYTVYTSAHELMHVFEFLMEGHEELELVFGR